MVGDIGTYEPENAEDVGAALRTRLSLKFSLNGEKLKGSWCVGAYTRPPMVVAEAPRLLHDRGRRNYIAPASILTRRTLAEIAEDEGGNVKKAATGDPKKIPRRTGRQAQKRGWQEKSLAQQGELRFSFN